MIGELNKRQIIRQLMFRDPKESFFARRIEPILKIIAVAVIIIMLGCVLLGFVL